MHLLPPSISPFRGRFNEEQAMWWVGLENPQLEEKWERLRETRGFRIVHPRGRRGSFNLANLQIKQASVRGLMVVTLTEGDSAPCYVTD